MNSKLSDGFAEVTGERVVVMVDSLVEAEDIDLEETRAEQQRTQGELESLGPGDENDLRRAELQNALDRANAQLAVAEKR